MLPSNLSHLLAALPHSEMLQFKTTTKPLPSTILSPKWEPEAEPSPALQLPMLAGPGWPPNQLYPVVQIQTPLGIQGWQDSHMVTPEQLQQQLAQAAQQAATSAMATWGVRLMLDDRALDGARSMKSSMVMPDSLCMMKI